MANGTPEQVAAQRRRYLAKNRHKFAAYKARYRREAGVVPVLITSPMEKLLRKLERWVLCPRADREDLSGLSLAEKRRRAKRQHFQKNPGIKRAYKRARERDVRRATPPWADHKAIRRIYVDAKKAGLTVDHIVPLRSKLVCGLHCEANLRLLPALENAAKSNLYWPEMPEARA